MLEQLSPEGGRAISFASRYLNAAEKKYFSNDLERLAVVWEGRVFSKIYSWEESHGSNRLVTLLNGNNKKSKTMLSRLTRWIDCIIPFDFVIDHMPGEKSDSLATFQDIRRGKPRKSVDTITLLQWQNLRWLQPISLQYANTSINCHRMRAHMHAAKRQSTRTLLLHIERLLLEKRQNSWSFY